MKNIRPSFCSQTNRTIKTLVWVVQGWVTHLPTHQWVPIPLNTDPCSTRELHKACWGQDKSFCWLKLRSCFQWYTQSSWKIHRNSHKFSRFASLLTREPGDLCCTLKYSVLICRHATVKAAYMSLFTSDINKNGLNSVNKVYVLSFLSTSCIYRKRFF